MLWLYPMNFSVEGNLHIQSSSFQGNLLTYLTAWNQMMIKQVMFSQVMDTNVWTMPYFHGSQSGGSLSTRGIRNEPFFLKWSGLGMDIPMALQQSLQM